MTSSPWYQQYCEEGWIQWYHKEFRYRFSHGFEDPDDACAGLIEKLILEKLPNAKLRHRENTDAFVKTTFRRLAQDLQRQVHGRLRPPKLLKEMGEPFPQVYFLFCLHKLGAEAIAETIRLPLTTVRDLVSWLVSEGKCRESNRHISLPADDTAHLQYQASILQSGQNDDVTYTLHQELQSAISHWLISIDPDDTAEAARLPDRLHTLPPPPLDSDDRILLKLLYWEGLTLTAAAEALNVPRHTARNRRNTVLKRLRIFFQEHGIDL